MEPNDQASTNVVNVNDSKNAKTTVRTGIGTGTRIMSPSRSERSLVEDIGV
jgi:hypothetical protein